jgi:2'-5' RNA ligase
MRLFVAIEVGSVVATAAGPLITELRHRAERLAPRARITWVHPDHAHLTIRFLGEVDQSTLHTIEGVLREPLNVPPFELTVEGLSAFPPRGQPRVLVASLSKGRDTMLLVEREITSRLEQANVPPDEKPYRPHLTLARVRDAAGLRSATLFEGLSGVVLGTVRVEASTLFQSKLSPKGPEYITLLKTKLVAG